MNSRLETFHPMVRQDVEMAFERLGADGELSERQWAALVYAFTELPTFGGVASRHGGAYRPAYTLDAGGQPHIDYYGAARIAYSKHQWFGAASGRMLDWVGILEDPVVRLEAWNAAHGVLARSEARDVAEAPAPSTLARQAMGILIARIEGRAIPTTPVYHDGRQAEMDMEDAA